MRQLFIRRKRVVEIYFVLYLAALILLLPDTHPYTNSSQSPSNKIQTLPFNLYPNKNVLTCRMVMDSAGYRILSIDSINTIYFAGNVSDVKFEFTVEDQSLNQRLTLKSEGQTHSKYFRLEERSEQQAANFIWKPPLNEKINKTYLVKVVATARAKVNSADGVVLAGQSYQVQTQFSLNVSYLGPLASNDINNQRTSGSSPGSTEQLNPAIMEFLRQAPPNEVFLKAQYDNIPLITRQTWKNSIDVYGISKLDMDKTVQLIVKQIPQNNQGKAWIKDISQNRITVVGIAPVQGSLRVELKLLRRSDGKQLSIDFSVNSNPLEEPIFETVMHPERQYEINPNLPLIAGQNCKAFLKEDNKIRAVSSQGESFKFTPDQSDNGKVFTLERYFNDSLVGQIYNLSVSDYQEPEIIRFWQLKDAIRMETRSFGIAKGRKNFIEFLEISGNATWREIFGSTKEDSKNKIYNQIFEITPKNPAIPFSFNVRAVDRSGKKSVQKSYP
ncbi:MAG: hypothetical protein HW421_2671 [Ignavibacteria bacterium]|nr:hypothetical protein [Ignavibacteria bacterium]